MDGSGKKNSSVTDSLAKERQKHFQKTNFQQFSNTLKDCMSTTIFKGFQVLYPVLGQFSRTFKALNRVFQFPRTLKHSQGLYEP